MPNRLSPMRFVVGFGIVALLGDFVYEGARSVIGPYLATLGASAAVVGLVAGAGEAVALVLRLVSGPMADRPSGGGRSRSPGMRSLWSRCRCWR